MVAKWMVCCTTKPTIIACNNGDDDDDDLKEAGFCRVRSLPSDLSPLLSSSSEHVVMVVNKASSDDAKVCMYTLLKKTLWDKNMVLIRAVWSMVFASCRRVFMIFADEDHLTSRQKTTKTTFYSSAM